MTVRARPGPFRPVKTASSRHNADGYGEDRAQVYLLRASVDKLRRSALGLCCFIHDIVTSLFCPVCIIMLMMMGRYEHGECNDESTAVYAAVVTALWRHVASRVGAYAARSGILIHISHKHKQISQISHKAHTNRTLTSYEILSGGDAGRPGRLSRRVPGRVGSETLETAERDAGDRAAVPARVGAAGNTAQTRLRRLPTDAAEVRGQSQQ